MVITFPRMGSVHVCVKALLDDYGIDYIIPEQSSKNTLEMGTRHCPEGACLPLKITIGNIIDGCNKGADTLLMVGGKGPCRFGYYCEMQREILHDIGYPVDVITLESVNGNFGELVKRVKKLTGKLTPVKWFTSFLSLAKLSKQVDEIEALCQKKRAIEVEKGATDAIYKRFNEDVFNVQGTRNIREFIRSTKNEISNIEVDTSISPIKVKIVGEIYTTIDPFTNLFLEKILGDMGVEVERPVTVSNWVIEHMLKKGLKLKRDVSHIKEAKPYLKTLIGGHAQETIGNTILAAKNGFDGVIQVYPLGCMPEIVAQSILKTVSNDYDIPVLTLIIDEMTGQQGYLTRLEAFIELLKQRREMKGRMHKLPDNNYMELQG